MIEFPLKGENLKNDSADRIIIPVPPKTVIVASEESLAVSQDVVKFPDQVSLIKNMQVWTFKKVPEIKDVYE